MTAVKTSSKALRFIGHLQGVSVELRSEKSRGEVARVVVLPPFWGPNTEPRTDVEAFARRMRRRSKRPVRARALRKPRTNRAQKHEVVALREAPTPCEVASIRWGARPGARTNFCGSHLCAWV